MTTATARSAEPAPPQALVVVGPAGCGQTALANRMIRDYQAGVGGVWATSSNPVALAADTGLNLVDSPRRDESTRWVTTDAPALLHAARYVVNRRRGTATSHLRPVLALVFDDFGNALCDSDAADILAHVLEHAAAVQVLVLLTTSDLDAVPELARQALYRFAAVQQLPATAHQDDYAATTAMSSAEATQ
ncbi:hypothetical protein SUDANB95_07893 (plasmid) [Actinosynnema sp. ALI-1.44]